jgi:LPXTG-motif cell wall-anchored protein
MNRATSLALRLVAPLVGLVCFATPLAAGQQNTVTTVPALDGVGLTTLAGLLAMGGAFWLSRRRDKGE